MRVTPLPIFGAKCKWKPFKRDKSPSRDFVARGRSLHGQYSIFCPPPPPPPPPHPTLQNKNTTCYPRVRSLRGNLRPRPWCIDLAKQMKPLWSAICVKVMTRFTLVFLPRILAIFPILCFFSPRIRPFSSHTSAERTYEKKMVIS